jgi:hypothetical protein
MHVCYLECHEPGLCCYLVIHIENLLRPVQLIYFHLWPVYRLSLVNTTISYSRVLKMCYCDRILTYILFSIAEFSVVLSAWGSKTNSAPREEDVLRDMWFHAFVEVSSQLYPRGKSPGYPLGPTVALDANKRNGISPLPKSESCSSVVQSLRRLDRPWVEPQY